MFINTQWGPEYQLSAFLRSHTELWHSNECVIQIQPWWLGGRASASHSAESSHYYLGRSNPACGPINTFIMFSIILF